MANTLIFLLKNVSSFLQKLRTFCSKYINVFWKTLATIFNEFAINKLDKLRMLWTTGPMLLYLLSFMAVVPCTRDEYLISGFHCLKHVKVKWCLLLKRSFKIIADDILQYFFQDNKARHCMRIVDDSHKMINLTLSEKYINKTCLRMSSATILIGTFRDNILWIEDAQISRHTYTVWRGSLLFSYRISGPSCSKLTTSLVNDSLKFTSSDTQMCWNFLLKKCE